MHKTGTTTLQNFLYKNRDLLIQHDIYVPESGRRLVPNHQDRPLSKGVGAGHHNLAWECNSDPRYSKRYGGFKQLKQELLKIESNRVVISSEDFGSFPNKVKNHKFLRDFFTELGFRVKVIAFIRPQYKLFDSIYSEQIKNGRHALGFAAFIEKGFTNPSSDFTTYFKNWKQYFDTIEVVNFDKLTDSLEDTFLTTLGIDQEILTNIDISYVPRANERIGPKTIEAFRLAKVLQDKLRFSPIEMARAREYILEVCQEKGWNETKFSGLNARLAQKIIDFYEASNLKFVEDFDLAKTTFITDARQLKFQNSRIALEAISKDELTEIMSVAQEAIINVRYPDSF